MFSLIFLVSKKLVDNKLYTITNNPAGKPILKWSNMSPEGTNGPEVGSATEASLRSSDLLETSYRVPKQSYHLKLTFPSINVLLWLHKSGATMF